MPRFCAAYGCVNCSDKIECKQKNISYHRFPLKDPDRLKQWLGKLKRENFVPNEHSVLCSEHFNDDDFEKITPCHTRRTLKADTVPSKFSFYNARPKRKKLSYQFPREDRNPSDSSKICSCHFIDKEKCNGPTIFPWNTSTMEKKSTEYISCSIPGCKSKFFRKMKDFIANGNGEDVLMFPVPHADESFNKWKEALKQTNIELSKDDHICEKHFLENDIERYCRTQTSEGNTIITEQLPTLKYDAVPIKFLKLPFPTNNSPVKPSVRMNDKIVMIKSKNSITDQLNSNSSAPVNNTTVSEMEIADDLPVRSSADSAANLIQCQTTPKKDRMLYEKLSKNIQRVKRPSKSWSVVCTDQFILFAKWNNKFIAEKRLVIESSLTIRVFLKDWEIEMTDLVDITSAEDVSSLLAKVENYKI